MSKEQNYFKDLVKVDVTKHIKKKGQFSYLSWAIAWNYIKTTYPDAQRTVYEAPETGLNWFTDGVTAYVKVGITVNGIEHIDYLPIKDFRHNSITIDKLTTMDVNTAVQRATAKAIAMHGLGLNLYANEDTLVIPEEGEKVIEKKLDIKKTPKKDLPLIVGDKNWDGVVVYLLNNKEKGYKWISNQLKRKYVISEKTNNVLLMTFNA
tara:strand:- start:257 stop:877 length:621 start_codon:yes stop_codon:yes gene_type:complete